MLREMMQACRQPCQIYTYAPLVEARRKKAEEERQAAEKKKAADEARKRKKDLQLEAGQRAQEGKEEEKDKGKGNLTEHRKRQVRLAARACAGKQNKQNLPPGEEEWTCSHPDHDDYNWSAWQDDDHLAHDPKKHGTEWKSCAGEGCSRVFCGVCVLDSQVEEHEARCRHLEKERAAQLQAGKQQQQKKKQENAENSP
jgi:hypothetical protein